MLYKCGIDAQNSKNGISARRQQLCRSLLASSPVGLCGVLQGTGYGSAPPHSPVYRRFGITCRPLLTMFVLLSHSHLYWIMLCDVILSTKRDLQVMPLCESTPLLWNSCRATFHGSIPFHESIPFT